MASSSPQARFRVARVRLARIEAQTTTERPPDGGRLILQREIQISYSPDTSRTEASETVDGTLVDKVEFAPTTPFRIEMEVRFALVLPRAMTVDEFSALERTREMDTDVVRLLTHFTGELIAYVTGRMGLVPTLLPPHTISYEPSPTDQSS